jgi:hypothetical protein
MPAEMFQFPPRRDGDVPPDAVVMLRRLAKGAAEAGADPQVVVAADLELLLVCDTILMLARQMDDAVAVYRTHADNGHAHQEWKRLQRAMKPAMLRATRCRAATPAGMFAKAVAVKRVGLGAAVLAVSLADDLLESPELRAVLWPVEERK